MSSTKAIFQGTILSLLCCIGFCANGQSIVPVTVINSDNGEFLQYAEVTASSEKSFRPENVKSFAVSDENGVARLKLDPGYYYIRVTNIGFVETVDSFHSNEKKIQMVKMAPSVYDLDHAVVTVQYKRQAAEKAVERVIVIDEKELQARSVVNLKEALVQQMNVQIRNDNSTGSSMSLMGISGQNVKILVDGVPVIGRLDGNIDLSQINMNDVARIEVIEGPVSTSYGSNALAGVINIITKKEVKGKIQATADTYWEYVGQYNANFSLGKKIGKTNVRFAGGRNFFGGWTPGDSGRWDLWKPKEQYFGRLQLNRKIGDVDWNLKTEYFNELLLNRGRPLEPYRETAFDERFYTSRMDGKIGANWKISEISSLNAFVAYNYYNRKRHKYFLDRVTLEEELISHDGGSDTTGFHAFMSRGTFNRIPSKTRLSYQVGWDATVETGMGVRISEGSRTISDVALFTTAEYQLLPQLSIKPGLRAAYNSAFKSPLVPMLSMRWKNKMYTYRGSYSQGFRAPDIKELYIEFIDINHNVVGNPTLRAERSHHALFSVDGKHLIGKMLIKPSARVFYNQIRDKISLANFTATEYTYVNISEFRSIGGNIRTQIIFGKHSFSAGYGITGVQSSLSNQSSGNRFYDEWNGNFTFVLGKYTTNIYAKYNGRQNIYTIDAENGEVTERFTESYSLVDLQVGRKFASDKIRLNVGIKNVLNVKNVNNVLASSGAHGSDSGSLAVATGRNPFIKLTWTL